MLALVVQAEPASRKHLLARSLAFAACSHKCFGGGDCWLDGIRRLCGPPRRLVQVCLLKAHSIDGDRLAAVREDMLRLPHVGDVEERKDCVGVRRLARIKRVALTFKGWLATRVTDVKGYL